MRASFEFVICDVFARAPLQGNQLAVFPHAAGTSTETMQALAREMHFSETTFILADEPNARGWPVRIFTPAREVPFAGHPTLGTAHFIWDRLLGRKGDEVRLDLRVGVVPVSVEESGERLMMTQVAPVFGPTATAAEVASVLGIEPEDVDPRWPVQEVSTGLWFFIVPVRTLDAVRSVRVDPAHYGRFIRHREAKAILVFCAQTELEGTDLHARVFCDYYGVPEDPATGSAGGCLAAWLSRHRYFGRPGFSARVEQGIEINRPSELFIEASEQSGIITVRVGGRVIPVAFGAFP